jgi:transposase InsO family protein
VTENPNKQGRRRPWVRFERDYSLVTAHLDWFHNSREQWVLAIEDDASRFVYDLIETDGASAERTVELLDEVCQTYETDIPILEVITDHGSEFVNTHQDDRPDRDHAFEGYLHEKDIEHSSVRSGVRSRTASSNGSIRPTRNSAGGSTPSRSFSTSTTKSGHT